MEKLKALREAKKMSFRGLGELVGVSGPTVFKWEAGAYWPSADKLPRLAEVLGCSIDELYSDAEKAG